MRSSHGPSVRCMRRIFPDRERGTIRPGTYPEDERRELSRHAGEAILFRITGPVSYAVGRENCIDSVREAF